MIEKQLKSKLVEVTAMKIQGLALIVTFRDEDGMLQARIISQDDMPGLRVGQTGLVSSKALITGTEYGIDWEVFLKDADVITPSDLEQEFRRRGLWTYEDINTNSPQVMASLTALSARLYAHLLSEARKVKLER